MTRTLSEYIAARGRRASCRRRWSKRPGITSSIRSPPSSRARGCAPASSPSPTSSGSAARRRRPLIGTPLVVPAETRALANGMAGHADETDDSHLRGRYHPGCGIVPAALAVAELAGPQRRRLHPRGRARLRHRHPLQHVARLCRAPTPRPTRTHTLGVNFGAAAAAAALLRFDARRRCATCCPTRCSRPPAAPTGIATASTSRRRSTSAAWARATASPAR